MKNSINDIKDTKELFQILSISKQTLSNEQKKSLNERGFVVIPPTSYMLENLTRLNSVADELIKKENDKGGWEGKEKILQKR